MMELEKWRVVFLAKYPSLVFSGLRAASKGWLLAVSCWGNYLSAVISSLPDGRQACRNMCEG